MVRSDRFQPQGQSRSDSPSPVRDGPQRTRMAAAALLLPWLIAGASLGNSIYGWVRADAGAAADSRYAAKHQSEFEDEVRKRLDAVGADMDKKFAEAKTRMDAADYDRDTRTLDLHKRVDSMQGAVISRVEDLQRQLNTRVEERIAQVNSLSQQLNTVQLKVCVLSGNRVSQCK